MALSIFFARKITASLISMAKRESTPSPHALAAILAASAIPFTPATAQEIQLADLPVAASPAPTIELPVTTPPPVAGSSVAPSLQIEPAAATPASPSAEAKPAQRQSRAEPARQTNARTSATLSSAANRPMEAAQPVTPVSAKPLAAQISSQPPPEPQIAPAEPVAVSTKSDTSSDMGWLLAALGLGGVALGGAATVAALNRRRRRQYLAVGEATPDDRRVSDTIEPVGAAAGTPSSTEAFVKRADLPAVALAAGPASDRGWREPFRIPSGPLPMGAERAALIERMASARPDDDNPFVSLKRRRKRARMLLASHELRQRQAATEPFDFRSYHSFTQTEGSRTLSHGSRTTTEQETVN